MHTSQFVPQEQALTTRYEALKARHLTLDLTRGKPAPSQLDLSNALDGILQGGYHIDGVDLRNYYGLDGLPSAKQLGAELLEVPADNVLVGGNSSLTLMYHTVLHALHMGVRGPESAWAKHGPVKFLCPVPGYDRHFAMCEELGIVLVPVAMTDTGPDMDQVEHLVKSDPAVKGLWCVPKYSNPTGCVYSESTVERLAALGTMASAHFRVLYDNAYAVHDLTDEPPPLANLWQACQRHGTLDSVVQFTSTSKITFAGAGLAFMATSSANLASFKTHLQFVTIGPDKINQQRHVLLLQAVGGIRALMKRHAALLQPKFHCVLRVLAQGLGSQAIGHWSKPAGGYFISFYTLPGLATEVVRLASEAGVKLVPAGTAYPYGHDPADSHIRLAPSFPSLTELEQAMEVFIICVQLATLRQRAHQCAAQAV